MAYPIVGKHADLKKGAVIGALVGVGIWVVGLLVPGQFITGNVILDGVVIGAPLGALIHKYVIM